MALARSLAFTNCTFLDPVPKSEVVRYIAACDVMLVPLRRSETFKTVIPSKIFEAAAMRRPVLLGVEGEAKAIIERYDAGECFVPEDRGTFLAALARIVDPIRQAQLTAGCAKLATAYDRRALAKRMLSVIDICVTGV